MLWCVYARSYEFDVIGPSYEGVAQVSLEVATQTKEEGQAAWSSDSLAFLVSINEVDAVEETETAVSFMWTTLAFAVVVNLVSEDAKQSNVKHTSSNCVGFSRWVGILVIIFSCSSYSLQTKSLKTQN